MTAVNVINVIFPYKSGGVWAFDDERVGLQGEPFVAGADVLLDKETAEIPDAVNGFRLTFSQHEFPEYNECLKWKRSEASGNVYWSDRFQMEGWLCPTLLKYFEDPPLRQLRLPCSLFSGFARVHLVSRESERGYNSVLRIISEMGLFGRAGAPLRSAVD